MRLLPALVVAASICLSGVVAMANEGASVVVTVNGVELTKAELNQEIAKIVPMEKNFHGGISDEKLKDARKRGMATLVDMELQYQDGLTKGHKLDKKQLEREIDLIVTKYPMKEAFEQAIEDAGFTATTFERFVSRNLVAKKIKEIEVDKKVNVTDAMVVSYYEENKSNFMKPDEYRASLILVKVPSNALPEQREEYRKKADEIYLQFKNGADFAELASKYSDDMSRIKGGDLGYFHAGQAYDSEFDTLISKLKVGEVSGMTKSLKGFFMVKLTDKKPPRQVPFDEIKEKIKLTLVKSEKERLLTSWMDSLRNKAKIVYADAGVKIDKVTNP